jgi:hypothetical protein
LAASCAATTDAASPASWNIRVDDGDRRGDEDKDDAVKA